MVVPRWCALALLAARLSAAGAVESSRAALPSGALVTAQPLAVHKLPVERFRPVEGPSAPQQVYYQVIEEDGRPLLHGFYEPEAETVTMGMEVPEALRDRVRRVKWRWRANVFPIGGNECRPGLGDSVASVHVAFKRGFKWWLLRYVWSPSAPLGAVCDRKRTILFARDTIVLESGGRPGTWFTETVDVHQAFIDQFEGGNRSAAVPQVVGIAVLTDGDQTKSLSSADWGDFELQY